MLHASGNIFKNNLPGGEKKKMSGKKEAELLTETGVLF